jgi:hypothetical protein
LSTQALGEDITFTKLDGFKIFGQTSGNVVKMNIPAGETRAILLKRQSDKAASMAMKGMITKVDAADKGNMF